MENADVVAFVLTHTSPRLTEVNWTSVSLDSKGGWIGPASMSGGNMAAGSIAEWSGAVRRPPKQLLAFAPKPVQDVVVHSFMG